MIERRQATTIGELDIHLGNVMSQIEQLSRNVEGVQQAVARLATRDYVDDQVRLVNERIHAAKPTTQLGNLAKAASGLLAIIAVLAFAYEVAITLHAVRAAIPVPAAVAKP
jgi:hypothetical protein